VAVFLSIDDLLPFAPGISEDKAQAMITDALAMASLVAPCINDDEFAYNDAAKAVIRGAILRWHESGQGVLSGLTALGFSQTVDNRVPRRTLYWPSEIEQLQEMCSTPVEDADKAWSYDMLGNSTTIVHDETCSVNFGAAWCSCGADLSLGEPLWGGMEP
jgi:hypothetical protein